MKQSFKVVTFNFDMNIEGHKLAESCVKYGYDLEVLGQGKPFINFRQAKLELLIEELEKLEEEYVMYTDGLDSWFLRPNILNAYKKYNADVVVSANRDHYPATKLYEGYPKGKTSFVYICSSQIIGRRVEVIKTLRTIMTKYEGYTDQEGWNYCYVKGFINVVVDGNCGLFLNMTNVSKNELDDKFTLLETGNIPYAIHFGGAKGNSPNAEMMRYFWNKSGI